MKEDPDAGSDIGNRIMSIAVLLAEEVRSVVLVN
jgi:hypothetical protein